MTEAQANFPLSFDCYQTVSKAAITIYKKASTVSVDNTSVHDKTIAAEFTVDGVKCHKEWTFFGEIDPKSLKIDCGGKIIELAFKKLAVGQWPHVEEQATTTKPLYEKWKKVKVEEEEEKSQDLDHFLQKIYKDATEEQKRAIMKSMTESGGTVLSTNWDEVSKHKVEPQPPK